MSESLLSFSEVLLFGRKLSDIAIVNDTVSPPEATEVAVVLTKKDLPPPTANVVVKGKEVLDNQKVLVKHRSDDTQTGLKQLRNVGAGNYTWQAGLTDNTEATVRVEFTRKKRGEFWKVKQNSATDSEVSRIKVRGQGNNTFVGEQLDEDACFARIYGFSFEGDYFDLPSPTLFLVHGKGELVSQKGNVQQEPNPSHRARAPREPSMGGMGAANFQFADDIRVWDYDKADYTIRMDVSSGMFEQVLLDATFGDGSFGVSGAKVSGAKVSGAKVSGAKVSGAKVSGAKARGPSD